MRSGPVISFIESNPGLTVAQIAKGTGRTVANVRQILACAYGKATVYGDARIPTRFYAVGYVKPPPPKTLIEVVRDALRARDWSVLEQFPGV